MRLVTTFFNICRQSLQHPQEEGKEPYGPTCRDYFWLLCRLVDILPGEVRGTFLKNDFIIHRLHDDISMTISSILFVV